MRPLPQNHLTRAHTPFRNSPARGGTNSKKVQNQKLTYAIGISWDPGAKASSSSSMGVPSRGTSCLGEAQRQTGTGVSGGAGGPNTLQEADGDLRKEGAGPATRGPVAEGGSDAPQQPQDMRPHHRVGGGAGAAVWGGAQKWSHGANAGPSFRNLVGG